MKNFEKMLYPKQLKKGDTVGIICPSSALPTDKIELVKSTIENMGYKTKLADNLDKVFAGYMAGDGEERAKWVNQMFADPEIQGSCLISITKPSKQTLRFSWDIAM